MLSQLEEVLEQLLQHISQSEPGTLFYAWYIDKARERCHVIEHYIDGEALEYHLLNYKDFAHQLNQLRTVERVVCCGELPARLKEGFASAGAELFELAGGLMDQHFLPVCPIALQ